MKSHKPKYKRILLKLSGEALGDPNSNGIDGARVADMAEQIGEVRELGIEVVIVIGGGNIFRGVAGSGSSGRIPLLAQEWRSASGVAIRLSTGRSSLRSSRSTCSLRCCRRCW